MARAIGRAVSPPQRRGAAAGGEVSPENLLLRQQPAVALRTDRRPRLRWHERLIWVVARGLVTGWRRHLVLVQPETVLRWHRRG